MSLPIIADIFLTLALATISSLTMEVLVALLAWKDVLPALPPIHVQPASL